MDALDVELFLNHAESKVLLDLLYCESHNSCSLQAVANRCNIGEPLVRHARKHLLDLNLIFLEERMGFHGDEYIARRKVMRLTTKGRLIAAILEDTASLVAIPVLGC